MHFILNRHLPTCSLFCFFLLPLTYLQATEEEGNEAYCTVSFWSIQKNSKQELLKLIDQERLIKGFNGNIPNQYEKKDYQVKVNSPAWPAVLRFLQDLKKSSTSSWRDLKLLYIYKKTDPEIEEQVNTFYKTGIIGTDMDIFITKNKKKEKIPINVKIENSYSYLLLQKLMVYPTTTIDDLECYLIYHINIAQEEKDMLFRRHYSFFARTDGYFKEEASDYEMETIQDINSNYLLWKREQFTCKFYLNQDGTLLSKNQLSDSSKIQVGMQNEWKCIKVYVEQGQFLLSILSKILPEKSGMGIKIRSIVSENNKYSTNKIRNWYPNKQKYTRIDSMTASFSVAEEPWKYALIKNEKENETKIKCILKMQGSSTTLEEELVTIRQFDEGVASDTLFIDAYYYLVNKAGYQIEQVLIQYPSITYQTKENSSESSNLTKDIYMHDSMFEYQKDLNIESYTFMMPKGAKVIREKTSQLIIKNQQEDHSPDCQEDHSPDCQINFWTVEKDGMERLLEDSDMQKLIEGIKSDNVANKYSKRSYLVEPNSLSWPPVLKFLNDLAITGSTYWRDFDLTFIEKYPNSLGIREKKIFHKAGFINMDMDIIVTKKKETKTPINVVVKNWPKELVKEKLLVYPNTRIDDLYCYFIYYTDMPQEVKDELYWGYYTLRANSNQLLSDEAHYRLKKINEINSDRLTWSKEKLTCSFYLNKNGTLLSQDQINDSEKIGKRMKEEWKCIKVNIEPGKPLMPVLSKTVPNIPLRDIQLRAILPKDDDYYIDTIWLRYMCGRKKKYMPAFTVSIHPENKSAKYALIEYKRKSEKKIKCILQKKEIPGIILEETLSIDCSHDPLDKGLHFIEAYTYLINKAGYQINPRQIMNSSVLITYKEKEDNSKYKGQIKKEHICMFDSMLKHQENLNIESYTFIMPKDGKLIEENTNQLTRIESKEQDQNHHSDILPNNDQQDSNNINQVVKYTIIACIALAIVSLVGYLIWKSKKKKEKTDSSAQTTE